jgi:hypothetical protein
MHGRIIDLLERTGPRTGAEIHRALGGDRFALWKTCMLSPPLAVARAGRRYLRLDRRVDGYHRLSPSILREFLTYTVVGLADNPAAIEQGRNEIRAHIRDVSRKKRELATSIMIDVAAPLGGGREEDKEYCVVLAGDIVYEMAHDVDRPERSTGEMVRGSDLDVVVIVSDEAPELLVQQLDDAIYRKKYQYLKDPAFREEIDYTVKRFGKLRQQAEFDTFERMVACKILDEGVLVYGSQEVFAQAKTLLSECGVVDRLRAMERLAVRAREQQEQVLLRGKEETLGRKDLLLFYTTDESEEFE